MNRLAMTDCWALGLSVVVAIGCGDNSQTGTPPGANGGSGTGLPTTMGSGGAGVTAGTGPGPGPGPGPSPGPDSGGSVASGGVAGMVGMAGTTATAGSGGAAAQATCTFTIPPATISAKIATVGIVEFSTDLAGLSAARIEFGLDTNYGMVAPVDVAAANHRTLLLGMKQRKTYHFRVVATGSAGPCQSTDQTIMTGSLPNGFPTIDVATKTQNKAELYGGFLLTGAYVMGGGGSGSPAYIVDQDGDVVWAYQVGSDVTGANMSIDGKYMWINSAQVPEGNTNVHRVSMDGTMDENLSTQFKGLNHTLQVLPDESVAFCAYSGNGCDDVKLRHPDGMVDTLYNSGTATGNNGKCTCNGIGYSETDNALVVSELVSNKYFKVKIADKSLVWVLGGTAPNDFTGDGSTWERQHGVHVLGADRLLFFNNGALAGSGSLAVELLLDTTAKTAKKAWTYQASPGIANIIMGDVQRLKNGNTIVAYSTKGVVHEVNAKGMLLEAWSWPIGGALGYISKRKSLYGPPER
jgi:hypothetical protein